MRQFSCKFLIDFAAAELRRLRRNEQRLKRFLGILLEQLRELLPHLFRVHVSYNNESEVIRHVARFVILHTLLLRELVIDFELADHWEPIRMPLVSGGKKK